MWSNISPKITKECSLCNDKSVGCIFSVSDMVTFWSGGSVECLHLQLLYDVVADWSVWPSHVFRGRCHNILSLILTSEPRAFDLSQLLGQQKDDMIVLCHCCYKTEPKTCGPHSSAVRTGQHIFRLSKCVLTCYAKSCHMLDVQVRVDWHVSRVTCS